MSSAPAFDLVLHGGTVRVGDLRPGHGGDVTDAVAVRSGRVVALGPQAAAGVASAQEAVDLDGGTVLPAFGDGHAHPVQGGVELGQAPVGSATTVADVVEAVRSHAADHPESAWVLGGGYDPSLAPGGVFEASWLDAAVPDRPVMLTSSDHHCAWLNSEAMRRAGIDAHTPDPPAGRIPRSADGRPLGTLVEWSAVDLALAHAPTVTDGQRRDGLRRAADRFAAAGVAWVLEAALDPDHVAVYRDVADAGHLPVRTEIALRAEPGRWPEQLARFAEERRAVAGHDRVSARTVKFFADGVVEAGTAALLEPYCGGPDDDRGLPVWPAAELAEAATAFDAAGFALHVHAIGDAAVRSTLDAVEQVVRANGPRDRRPVLTHVQVVHPDDLPRFAALGVVANIQPLWACLDACQTELTQPRLGPRRSAWQYPFADLARSGAVLSTGSDWPVSSLRPLETLAVAVTRATPDDGPAWLADQRLTRAEVLHAATAGTAHQSFEEASRGVLAVGRRADLVWLTSDPLAEPARTWPGIAVRGTWCSGKRTHGA